MSTVVDTPALSTPATRRTTEVRMPGFLADTWNVMVRELKPVFREPASVLFAMVQPLVFLGLFAPLLPEVENGSALQWFVPGIVAMTALMGASFTGANLTQEIVTGSHERLLVSPLSRSSPSSRIPATVPNGCPDGSAFRTASPDRGSKRSRPLDVPSQSQPSSAA